MATVTFEYDAAPGLTLTTEFRAPGSDTIIANSSTASTEGSTDKGSYQSLVTDCASGFYKWRSRNASSQTIARGLVYHINQTGVVEMPCVSKVAALENFMFRLTSSSDHVTPKTSATVVATRAIDGAAFAACTNSVAEIGNGIYKITLSPADLAGNFVMLKLTATGADQLNIGIYPNT